MRYSNTKRNKTSTEGDGELLRKSLHAWIVLVAVLTLVTACTGKTQQAATKTRIYQSENGQMKLPENPK